VAEDLDTPWGIAFLPDGTALVTERDSGRVLLVGRGTPRVVGTVRQVSDENDEAGLLGVAVGPRFAQDRRVWLYVTSDEDNRIVTTTYADGRLGPVRPVLTGIPKGAIHDGGRLAFGPDGYLYASTGETGQRELAADLRSLGGKILRITGAGDPAPGNPFPGSPVWSWGHRNVQGLAWVGSELWASEFGADTWDELNRVERGRDHGWPAVEGRGGTGSQVDPALVWRTADASPSGLAWAGGALWMAALRGERLWRIPVRGGEAGRPEGLFIGEHGRMRTVARTPEGRLWVTTSNRDGRGSPGADDDRILEVAP
jgi:glucose/arabinose dehydrogenase